jgi:hypothetical protein
MEPQKAQRIALPALLSRGAPQLGHFSERVSIDLLCSFLFRGHEGVHLTLDAGTLAGPLRDLAVDGLDPGEELGLELAAVRLLGHLNDHGQGKGKDGEYEQDHAAAMSPSLQEEVHERT